MAKVLHLADSNRAQVISECAAHLRNGSLVAFPCDSSYGLLAPIGEFSRLHQVRNRAADKPFLFVLPAGFDWQTLVDVGATASVALAHVEAHWPGLKTFVLPKHHSVSYPEGDTIALRVPSSGDNADFAALLIELAEPLLAPSLNQPGQEPLKGLQQIEAEFGEVVDVICYDAEFQEKQASEIWDLTSDTFVRLR